MPLELVQEIDEALTEIVKWYISNARRERARDTSSGDESTEKEELEWSSYPYEWDLKIRRLILSPICLGLACRLLQLAAYHMSSTPKCIIAILIAFGIIKLADPLLPFQKVRGIKSLYILLPAFVSLYTLSSLFSCCIYLDAFIVPILGHTLEDISDREQIHYISFGIFLGFIFDMTMIALYRTRSLLYTIVISIGVTAVVQTVEAVLLLWYLACVPADLLLKFARPPFLMAFCRLSLQQNPIWANRALNRWLYSFSYSLDVSSTQRGDMEFRNSYKYRPLPAGYIRLLKILPGIPSDVVRCQFVEISLEVAPAYQAMSYIWGDSNETQRIIVNGKVFSVTANAYSIIRRRRSRLHERLIWIDQVCINQKSIPEKSVQVQIMKSIYLRAALVVAWLGPSQDAHLVQSFLAQLHFFREGKGWSGEEIKLHSLSRSDTAPKWSAIAEFFRNPWFHRVWIVQEVASARKLHIIYGNICMDWTYIGRGVAVLLDNSLLDFLPGKPNDTGHNILKRRPAATGIQNADTMLALRGDINYKKHPFTLFRLVTHYCRFFDSTDPRDKVFSILSLATDNDKDSIVSDYNNTNVSVYIKTTKYLLEKETNPIDLLADAGTALGRGDWAVKESLPSWVPDLSFVSSATFTSNHFTAGKNRPSYIRFDNDPFIIHLEGMIIDSVDSQDMQSSVLNVRSGLTVRGEILLLQQWIEEAKNIAKMADPKRIEEPFDQAFFRTIVADELDCSDEKLSAEQCIEGYTTLSDYFSTVLPFTGQQQDIISEPEPPPNKTKQDMIDLILRFPKVQYWVGCASIDRRFCVTTDGRMAIIPDGCEEGDFICIMSGANMPFILRRAEKDSRVGYQLVGCCYVDGVMHGEKRIENPEIFTLF